MQETKPIHSFDINPIMIDVEKAIQQGLNNLLSNYIERHEILEKTHQQLIQLPSIAQELNKRKSNTCSTDSESEAENNGYTRYFGIKHNSRGMTSIDDVSKTDSRLDKLEKNFDYIVPILDLLVGKISSLKNDINEMKRKEYIVHTTDIIEKSSVVKTSENENIEIHIEEPNLTEGLQEEEISDDEDENPALITCSTISLKKEDVTEIKNEYEEVSQEHIEEDEELSVEQELGIEENDEKTPTEEESIVEEEEQEVQEESVEEEQEELVEEEQEELVEEEEPVEEEEQEELVEEEEELVQEESVEEEQIVEEQVVDEEASIETETKEEVEEEDEEQEEELFEIEIDDTTYCTNDDQNGFIWELTEDGEQGNKIGYLKDGDAYFYEDEN